MRLRGVWLALLLVAGAATAQQAAVGPHRLDGTGGSGGGTWGSITGTLSAQSDLNTALGLKAPLISPSFTTPALGVATGTSFNGNIWTTSTGTFTLGAGKTFTVSSTLTLAGTDSTVMTFPTTSATIARTDAAQGFTGTQTMTLVPTFTDVTTGNVSTSAHGLVPKATGVTTDFLNANGVYSTPAGGANTALSNVASVAFGAAFSSAINGALSAPAFTLTGTAITGGSTTTTKPLALIEPAGATSNIWSTAGTMLGVNSAAGFTGNLIDLQGDAGITGSFGTSAFKVSAAGIATVADSMVIGSTARLSYGNGSGVLRLLNSGASAWVPITLSSVGHTTAGLITWSNSTNPESGLDAGFSHPGAGEIAVGNGTANDKSGTLDLGTLAVYTANNATYKITSSTESLTLSTGGTTTATSGNLAPVGYIDFIDYRITTGITTATAFTVKVTGGNAFCTVGTATTSQGTVTVNTTGRLAPCAFGDWQNGTATTLTVTTTGTPGAGVLELTTFTRQTTAPTS